MLKLSKKVLFGTIVVTLLATLLMGSAFAWTAINKNVPVRFAQIKLIVDGKTIQTKAEPFIYDGNVYAPVATVANGLGIRQEWDNNTPAVRLSHGTGSIEGISYEMYINDFENKYAGYQQLFNLVSLKVDNTEIDPKTFEFTFKPIGIKNYATGKELYFKDIISGWDNVSRAKYIDGSARPELDGKDLNDGTFALQEIIDGKTYVTQYQLNDEQLTKVYSFQIEHDVGVKPVVTGNGLSYTVRFYKNGDLIGVQDYYEKNGKWVVSNELFR